MPLDIYIYGFIYERIEATLFLRKYLEDFRWHDLAPESKLRAVELLDAESK